MIQSAEKYPVSDLFGIDKDVKYVIPKYQREYVWKKQNWEKLFDDVLENPKGHFLGSIITVNKNRDALLLTELELIDGQQRFTTISLLYAAIYYVLTNEVEESEKDEELLSEVINLKYRLIQKANKSVLKVEPSHQRRNLQDYLVILSECKLMADEGDHKNVGNRRIYKAYNYFYERLIESDSKGKRLFDTEQILEFLNKLNSSLIVKIEVNSHSDAFTLFETINNTGVKLSAIDLIKNNILSQHEKKLGGSIDEAFNKWQRIINNLPDDVGYQERFLRQYYNAFKHGKLHRIEKISVATKSNIISIYEELIDRDVEKIFNDLVEKSKIYGNLINADNDNFSDEFNQKLKDLDRIGGTPAYSLLLYSVSLGKFSEQFVVELLDFLVKYFVRRNLTDIPPTRDLDRIFISLIEKIETEKGEVNLEYIKNYFVKKTQFATSKQFKDKLYGNIYEENASVARFILCKIEELNNKTKEIYTDLWARDKGDKYIWTIEHVFPQGDDVPKAWVDMIANGDIEKAQSLLETHTHVLGNLTITGYNSQLSNFSFDKKRDRQDRKGNYVGYRNGLFLNKDLKNAKSWAITDIEERTEYLAEKTLNIFSLD